MVRFPPQSPTKFASLSPPMSGLSA